MINPTFLKWPGGKRRLIEQMESKIPKDINNYYEPFMGAASVFFHIKQKFNPKQCTISDLNEDLVNVFISVRDNPKELMRHLEKLKKDHSEENYYLIREKFNLKKFKGIKRSAVFIYLNKTCYNGMYRVNSKGEFNVPIGRYKNPEIYNKENILSASELLQGVNILCQDYRKIVPSLKKGDFVYLDPCYDPLKKTSFVAYTPGRFKIEDRYDLFDFMVKARKNGANLMLSNNNLELVKEMYLDQKFKVNIIYASRSVNSNPLKRGKIPELLITN